MKALSDNIINYLVKRTKYVVPVVEIYPRDVEDLVSINAPSQAIGRFSLSCFYWETSAGTHQYDAKVLDFPEITTYLDERLNTAEVTLGNAARGETSASRFVLDNKIKGCYMVIRLVFPELEDESVVLFWGKCKRPGKINNKELTISASQDLGNSHQEIPFRSYQSKCPIIFGGELCIGNETLTDKNQFYQQAFAALGTGGCNKLFTTCALYQNTEFFQGQRVVAVSGQFSYITIEEVVKRVLFWTKRKKIPVVKMDNWSSVNQSEGSEIVPIAFGRCQIEGHPFTWGDLGTQVRSLQGFCEGKISAYTFIRSRTEGINIVQKIEHLGDWGNTGTQQPDTIFNGASGFNSKLAYLELITDGSTPTQVDNAPLVTAVIRGLEIPIPDVDGQYSLVDWTNNPVHITRYLLTDSRFGRVPLTRIDDSYNLLTAAECDTIVEDRTNAESIVLPSNEFDNYGLGYRRFRSAGRFTAYKDLYDRGQVPDLALYPEFEEPEVRWYNPFQPYTLPPRNTVLRQKYTLNGALQEKTSLLDFIYKRVLPVFKGYIDYGYNGKIQIKTKKKADNGYLRMDTTFDAVRVPVSNITPWRLNTYEGFLLIGVSKETAEIRTVTGFEYSTACNELPIAATVTGTVTATTSNMAGGNAAAPSLGYIDFGGTINSTSSVELSFNTGDDLFTIGYTADGVEDIPCFTRMVMAYLNANIQFQSYLTAYVLPDNPNRIWVRCEAGYVLIDKPLQYEHKEFDEVMRVQAVFENCGELTANESAQFDNIIADTFEWNDDEEDEINAVVAKYTSAIDDFHLQELIPRAAWDIVEQEGELNKHEMDLTFVDNYWQAAYLAKTEAIERIDGNLHFSFKTGLSAIRLDLGDVVAVRHDSGDGALNYVPVWVNTVSMDLETFTVEIGAKLYLSAMFDLNVQPVEPLLTTTLGTSQFLDTPPTIGTNGGVGHGTDPVVPRPAHDYYTRFNISKYSPDGTDRV